MFLGNLEKEERTFLKQSPSLAFRSILRNDCSLRTGAGKSEPWTFLPNCPSTENPPGDWRTSSIIHDSMNNSEELELLTSERGVSPEGARCKELCTKSSATSGLGVCPATGCPFKPTPLASTRSSGHLDMRQGMREPSQPPGNNDLEGKWKMQVIPENCSVEGSR